MREAVSERPAIRILCGHHRRIDRAFDIAGDLADYTKHLAHVAALNPECVLQFFELPFIVVKQGLEPVRLTLCGVSIGLRLAQQGALIVAFSFKPAQAFLVLPAHLAGFPLRVPQQFIHRSSRFPGPHLGRCFLGRQRRRFLGQRRCARQQARNQENR